VGVVVVVLVSQECDLLFGVTNDEPNLRDEMIYFAVGF